MSESLKYVLDCRFKPERPLDETIGHIVTHVFLVFGVWFALLMTGLLFVGTRFEWAAYVLHGIAWTIMALEISMMVWGSIKLWESGE
ncbi:MAG TPA: hypothetical protein ENH89_13625 [Aurantimonas coralicida]|nr:hypothetical protein [Aurantimonas coralicida]